MKLRALAAGLSVAALCAGCTVRPVVVTDKEVAAQTESDLRKLFSNQVPISGPIGLHEAMARAIRYNLDHRVQLMEGALRHAQLAAASSAMLPRLSAAAGYSNRNNDYGASSRSLISGTQSLEPSTSQERTGRTAEVILAWNVLDFGVSYAIAQQQANRGLISEEKRRKVIQNIIQDVRYAFWRAASAQQLLPEMDRVLGLAQSAIDRLDRLEKSRIKDPAAFLSYRKQLLELTRRMWTMREKLASAKTELAALINVPPGTQFTLTTQGLNAVPKLNLGVDQLEELAMSQRPELREELYQARISALEVKKVMRRMLPGIELSGGLSHDTNKFLFNNSWAQIGLQVTWNIMNIIHSKKHLAVAKGQGQLDEMRRLSLRVAVITQVNLAVLRYEIAKRDFQLADELWKVEQRIRELARAKESARQTNALDTLRFESSSLVARMNRALSLADMRNAYGRIQHSIGHDPLPDEAINGDLPKLVEAIKARSGGLSSR